MSNVGRSARFAQAAILALGCLAGLIFGFGGKTGILESADAPAAPAPVANPDAEAKSQAGMKKYTELLTGTDVAFEMVPIPGGEFVMGSPDSEPGRGEDESP